MEDPADPRVRGYVDVRERDLSGRENLFVLEGENVLRVLAARSLYRPVSVLVSEARARAEQTKSLLDRVPDGVPIYVAAQPVLDRIVGFHIHRGVLALAERGAPRDADELLASIEGPATVVAAVGITNHDNVGGLFRNAAAFGARAVLLDAASCDPLYRKAVRVSVGGALVVPFARVPDGHGLLDALARGGFEPLALSPRGRVEVRELRPGPRRALVLGTEGEGLPEELMARATTVRIAMRGDFDSLNVAVAAGIALHALFDEVTC